MGPERLYIKMKSLLNRIDILPHELLGLGTELGKPCSSLVFGSS